VSLDDLDADLESAYADLEGDLVVDVDRETRQQLAMLSAALGTDRVDELVRRAVHDLFRRTVDTGDLDFHLRSTYGVTYDEYLSGMTYDEMTGGGPPAVDDDRRYRQ
jgi:hypothetical protein